MSSRYRNIFLLFGIIAIIVMFCTFDMEYEELWAALKRAGIWFPMILLLWVVIYLINAIAWYIIIHGDKNSRRVPFWKVYKLTISGYALNYATPVGLMGGEPYRMMELTPYVGTSKATSSVILYAMMHIVSHFYFWLLGIILYLVCGYPMNVSMGWLLFLVACFAIVAIYFFMKGYRHGMALKTISLLCHIPYVRRWARGFIENRRPVLERIDSQIAALHRQRKVIFYSSLGLELLARVVGSIEVYCILNILTTDVSFISCVLIMAFTSLFANIFFFSPMQLGAREGGFALAVWGLAIPAAFGVYTSLITRMRELTWIAIGILLIKIGNSKPKKKE